MPTKTGTVESKPEFLEFFAGGGLSRLGLGKNWECTFARRFLAPKRLLHIARILTAHGIACGRCVED